jgi:hypothetical protein
MRFGFIIFFSFPIAFLMSACGVLYERESEAPSFLNEVTSTIASGDTRQKVRTVLGKPLLELPSRELEVYLKSGRDIGVVWVIAPWVPVPTWGDKSIAVILVLYDDKGKVRNLSSGLWKEERYRFESASVDADGYSFVNISHKQPATLLSPPLSSNELANIAIDHENCTLIFDMGQCPMEKILVDDHEIADFPYVGQYCDVDGGIYQGSNHIMFDTLLWVQIEPGVHNIYIHHRGPAVADLKKSVSCKPGEVVVAKLLGSQFVTDRWHGLRLEGTIQVTYGTTNILRKLEGARFILWHEGSWYGLPNVKH